jgi:hypothetical protein
MSNRPLVRSAIALAFAASVASALAVPWREAEVTRVHNQVLLIDPGVGRRPAVVRDIVKDDLAVQTGIESRAELRFPDSTLTRLAANTLFSFREGTREMDLRKGAIFFQVPPGSGGAKIHAAAITAAITGTSGFVERIGDTYKLIVLEGEVRVYMNDRARESILVRGGQMIIASIKSKSMKDWVPVDVDVKKLVRSSTLLNRRLFAPLPPQAVADINSVITQQGRDVANGALNPTNLVINGGVSTVVLADNTVRDRTDTPADNPNPPPTTPGGAEAPPPPLVAPAVVDNDPVSPGPAPTPNPNPTPTTNPTPSSTPRVIARPEPYVISPATRIVTRTPSITTDDTTNSGRIYRGNAADGSAALFVFDSMEDFDLRSNFDARFGRNLEPEFAPNGVAVFNFRSLRLEGSPVIDTSNGPNDLALVAMNASDSTPGIESAGPGGNWDLSGLRSLFLGTAASSIALDRTIGFFAEGPTFQYLQLYARGANSDAVVGSIIRLNRNLYIDTERDTILAGTSEISGRALYVNAGRDLRIAGTTDTMIAQLNGTRAVVIDGSVRAGTAFLLGSNAQVNGTLTADNLDVRLSDLFANGANGSRIAARQFVISAGGFALNTDPENGTVFDTANLTSFNANVGALELLSNFAIPASAVGNLTVRSNIDADNRALTGFQSIITQGSGEDRLRTVTTRSYNANGDLVVRQDMRADVIAAGGIVDIGRELLPNGPDPSLLRSVSADRINIDRGINFAGRDGDSNPDLMPGNGFSLDLFASRITISDPSGMPDPNAITIAGANLDGGNAAPPTTSEGGSGGTLNIGTEASAIAGDVNLRGSVSATTGRNGNTVDFGGAGGTVNVVANGTIDMSSSITVSGKTQRRESRRGGNVRLTSRRTTGTAIRLTSTAQIASLLAAGAPGPGGEVVFRSAGGDVDIRGTVTADRGRIDIENTGPNGRVALNGATLSADVIRARAFGDNGTLVVNGGTISADSMIKLYADGSNGTVLFSGNVSLSGNSTKIITGNTVTISPNVVVTVGGPQPAQVYTNNPNYTGFGGNGSSSGTFGGAGATTQPRNAAPGY